MARVLPERRRGVREGYWRGRGPQMPDHGDARSLRALKATVRSMDLILSFTQRGNVIGLIWSRALRDTY